ncbi:MAG: tellurium resistance protein [Rhodobacterales bacterium]|nr:MAG: tellurium resistance protein [Rhodobacterales bacterium]
MLTASRLFGAIICAALAWFVSDMFKPLVPDDTNFGRMSEYNAVIGLVCGWVYMGLRYGRKIGNLIASGITTVVVTVFWVLLINSIAEMVRLSFRKRFDNVAEALLYVGQQMLDYGLIMLNPQIVVALAIGSVFLGLASGWAGRKWD